MSASATDIVRRSLIKIDAARVLSVVDELDLRPGARVTAVVGVPLRSLQQRRDVAAFAASAPVPAVRALLEVIALEPLDRVVVALGEHAESPTYEQLAGALDSLVLAGMVDDDVVAVLCFAIGESFPAAAHCRRLLDEREAWRLPELATATPSAVPSTVRGVDPAVKEARRQRREAQRRKKPSTPPPPRHAKAAKVPRSEMTASPAAPATPRAAELSVHERRAPRLTPRELALFDGAHPLVGSIVLADVPYDAIDPTAEEASAKERPALVVAASETGALVRGIYSQHFVNRHVFTPWRRLQLDHVSYISDERVAVEWASPLVTLGELTDEEWNGLF
ncbi:MAG: hypothetical protein KGI65_05095 [Acidobacteriota bacterium]|nr:hypothetical protein [Acidobacteriota bacterium]